MGRLTSNEGGGGEKEKGWQNITDWGESKKQG